jgi:hypothetical protein
MVLTGMVNLGQLSLTSCINASPLGNPVGGLVFSNAYGNLQQMHEWTVSGMLLNKVAC